MNLVQRRRGREQNANSGSAGAAGGVQALTRALSILGALAESDDGLTLTSLAKSVVLPPSTEAYPVVPGSSKCGIAA